MIKLLKKTKKENLEETQKQLDAIAKRLYQENQKMIDDYFKERK